MRGPLLSGAIGSPAALTRLAQILRARPPTVVLSSLWLASALAAELPVLVLVEGELRKAARRAGRKAAEAGRRFGAVLAGEALPVGEGQVGSLVVEDLLEVDEGDAAPYLMSLTASLRPDGVLLALDRTKDPAAEARVAGAFLAAGLVRIAQERPREGALLTVGQAPHPVVRAALAAGGEAAR
jgi:hypothetical protein